MSWYWDIAQFKLHLFTTIWLLTWTFNSAELLKTTIGINGIEVTGVRGFFVCDISVMQGICTIKWIFVFYKQNPTKPNRLRIWGYYKFKNINSLLFVLLTIINKFNITVLKWLDASSPCCWGVNGEHQRLLDSNMACAVSTLQAESC